MAIISKYVYRIKNGRIDCRCRPAKRHRDCSYCGQGWDDGKICGMCKQNGIDGKVIAGTSKVTCSKHKE